MFPLCKNDKTRLQAYELLTELCKVNNTEFAQVAKKLSEYFSKGFWRGPKKLDWMIDV